MDFETLYETQFHTVHRFIRYMVSSAELAEDLTQETFMRYLRQTHEPNHPPTYLKQIARNLVYDYYRKKALIQWIPFMQHDTRHAVDYIPHDWILTDENRKLVYEALQRLKPISREVIIHRQIEQLSIEETALLMGISPIKVANTQRTAMKQLQRYIGGDLNEVR